MLQTIKYLVFLRSILASIGPIVFYSIGYGLACLFISVTMPYFSAIPWLIIAGLSIVYPVNRIGLTMLFAPLEYRLNNKLKLPENPVMKGNFKPIKDEDLYEVVEAT